jgi:hypothetical protein
MTIDSSWLSCFKSEAPDAFTDNPLFRATAVFSDGQIRLMQSPPSEPQTWDDYIYNRFVRYYGFFLKKVDTLVIAFDNYQYVPPAKCMTQDSRRKHVPKIAFSETSPLPCMVPEGESWTECISNRTFKVKVIELLVMRLPKLLLAKFPTKTIILDYDVPEKYTKNEDGTIAVEVLSNMTPQGEADVKFTKWTDIYRKIIIDSIDGDSVPIALIHHEKLLSQEVCPPQVSIYRMVTKDLDASKKLKKLPPPPPTVEAQEPPKKKAKVERHYEYLDIHMLYLCLQESIKQSLGRETRMVTHDAHTVRMIVALVILTGTDFSRHLPQLSGKTVWDMVVSVWIPLAMAYDPVSGQLKNDVALHRLIGKIYSEKFFKHVSGRSGSYQEVYKELMQSHISNRTKQSLASVERIKTTIKNCNWILQYWQCETVPNPISDQFGYVMVNRNTRYEDLN